MERNEARDPLGELSEQIRTRILTLQPEPILEAVELLDRLPAPGPEPADRIAVLVFDVAFHAECLSDWELCVRLYRRCLAYTISDARLATGAWYRCALCLERMGALREAMAGYRQALAYGEAWPYVTALARARLSKLLMAAEEHQAAAELLRQLGSQ